MKPIEEHTQAMKVAKSVFAAVMQAQGWARGTEVSEETFGEAVRAFLEGPMGGTP
ncbi:MAG: hypothetical protein LBD93_03325 [Treponema sp.]|jgi:hypothetical protein|nr:hypothetical protein [Treponema sp.]